MSGSKRLEGLGVITGYRAVLDPIRIGQAHVAIAVLTQRVLLVVQHSVFCWSGNTVSQLEAFCERGLLACPQQTGTLLCPTQRISDAREGCKAGASAEKSWTGQRGLVHGGEVEERRFSHSMICHAATSIRLFDQSSCRSRLS